jgi:hypothetical protein
MVGDGREWLAAQPLPAAAREQVSDQERALDLDVRKLGLHGAADVPMGSVPLAGGQREGRDDDGDRAVALGSQVPAWRSASRCRTGRTPTIRVWSWTRSIRLRRACRRRRLGSQSRPQAARHSGQLIAGRAMLLGIVRPGAGADSYLRSLISDPPKPRSGLSMKKTSIVMSSSTFTRPPNATTLRPVSSSITC